MSLPASVIEEGASSYFIGLNQQSIGEQIATDTVIVLQASVQVSPLAGRFTGSEPELTGES